MATEELKPVYLLTGSDRPKHARALARLRARFGDESVETRDAADTTGPDAAAACNALGLFAADGGRLVVVNAVESWKKADVDAIAAYLEQPAPGAVLALVAHGTPKNAALVALCQRHGQVLSYDVPKPSNLHAWVRSEFERLGAKADAEAARALVEICGDDVVTLATEVEKIAAWADGQEIGRDQVEELAAGGREAAAWALTDAWGARDLHALLAACEKALERKEAFSLAMGMASHVGRVRAARLLAAEGLRTREIASRLKIKEYPARKALQHAEQYSPEELDAAVVRLADLDAALKGASRLSAELELDLALVAITRTTERAGTAADR